MSMPSVRAQEKWDALVAKRGGRRGIAWATAVGAAVLLCTIGAAIAAWHARWGAAAFWAVPALLGVQQVRMWRSVARRSPVPPRAFGRLLRDKK